MLKSARIVVAIVAISGCGGEITKDGTPANSGANANVGPQNNGATSAGRMEQGSSDSVVLDAYRRINPLMCNYDATCADPMIQEACPPPAAGAVPEGQCWVVDSAGLTQCESALRGLQCQGQWENFPMECYSAVRQCECLDGYVSAWNDEGMMGCYAPCQATSDCSGALGCYDGACMPMQEGRCPDDQALASFDGEPETCYDTCRDGQCDDGLVCTSGLCVAEAP